MEYKKNMDTAHMGELHCPKPGRMYVSVDEKIAAAASQEERDAWESWRDRLESRRLDFCAGWHVGIYKHACGHWEVLQHPIFKNHDGTPKTIDGRPYTAEDADQTLRGDSLMRLCSACVCRR